MNTATGATKGNKGPVLMKANTAHFICKTQHSSGDTWLHFKSALRNIEPEKAKRSEYDFFGSQTQDCYHLSSKGMSFVTLSFLSFSPVATFGGSRLSGFIPFSW